jgi:serine/threonine-protein kinase
LDPLVGLVLDERYRIISEIGRGALGIVYKAEQLDTGEPVAVKIMFEDMINDDRAFDRFSEEAQAASSLSHPNIVSVIDFGLTDFGYAYFVMDCLEGENLQVILNREVRLPIKRALQLFVQISDALAHAHSRTVIHSDIKPENIIVISRPHADEQVKVVDFGLAKRFQGTAAGARSTINGEVLGTPAYMSPEQVMGGRALDARSDIYSLGCLMYVAVTGVPPIWGADAEQTMSLHLSLNPQPPSLACPGALIPANVQQVIMKTLKKFPEERYQTMALLQRDLLALLN